jgi:hypothetical protein
MRLGGIRVFFFLHAVMLVTFIYSFPFFFKEKDPKRIPPYLLQLELEIET